MDVGGIGLADCYNFGILQEAKLALFGYIEIKNTATVYSQIPTINMILTAFPEMLLIPGDGFNMYNFLGEVMVTGAKGVPKSKGIFVN